jgi:lipopolysaccharide/colanic/teichoic acid biosynthesis glycosyltransferase
VPHASTIWGLSPTELHDRFWASRGVQVVRPGEPSAIVPHAELYLLLDPAVLTIFRPAPLLDTMTWLAPDLMMLRITDSRRGEYNERVKADAQDRFLAIERIYEGTRVRMTRVGLTTDREVARIWQAAPDALTGWKRLRRVIRPSARYATSLPGRVFRMGSSEQMMQFVRDIVRRWRRPDAAIDGIRPVGEGVWSWNGAADKLADRDIRGPLWIGSGRELPSQVVAVGPAVLWDDPERRPTPAPVGWSSLEPISESLARAQTPRIAKRPFKRAFDIVFALLVLAITLPLYPFIALAIFIEDRGPIFFSHQRETLGGRRFGCLKFRSMRRDAEAMKSQLVASNKADGPQFFIPDDPRLTRVGRILRDFQLDELPQFLNVLKGDMSVVGPRPSPFKENQFCPAWREARLSVRPGVTGLWQIRRTRAEGTDFQEWIKYDIEYVEQESFLLDLWIIWRTIFLVLKKVTRS